MRELDFSRDEHLPPLAGFMRPRFNHGTVVAYLALFIALGGSSYAAVQLSRDSVKSKHIAKGAVNSKAVENGSLLAKDFASGELPTGPTGPVGAKGETGAPGPAGAAGANGSATSTAPTAVDLPDTTVASGTARLITTVGPFSIRMKCDDKTAENSAWAAWSTWAEVNATAPGVSDFWLAGGEAYQPKPYPADAPTPAARLLDWTGNAGEAWAPTGEVLRLVGRVRADQTSCRYTDATAYLWR